MAEQQQNHGAPEENLTEVVKVRREKLEALKNQGKTRSRLRGLTA